MEYHVVKKKKRIRKYSILIYKYLQDMASEKSRFRTVLSILGGKKRRSGRRGGREGEIFGICTKYL